MISSNFEAEPRREPRNKPRFPRIRREEPAGDSIDELKERVARLEADRDSLRDQLRGQQRGGGRRRTARSDTKIAAPAARNEAPIPLVVEGPKTLAHLKHLLIQIESKQRDEHTSPEVSGDLDAMFERLGATTLGQTDVSETRSVADQLDHLDMTEENNVNHNPKRRSAIAAAKSQLRSYLPLRSVELTTAVEELRSLKEREDLLFESKPLPKFDSVLERNINAAYSTLAKTAFSCTPSEAVAIRREMKQLYKSEEKRFAYKFGSNRWFTSYSAEEKTAQRLYDGRRNMYHTRTKQIQDIIEKLDKISSSSSMFWRMLGRGKEKLAA